MYAGCGLMMLFGGLMFILFLALVVGGIVWLVRTLAGRELGQTGSRPTADALDILKTRYAKGEISKEQFEEMKRDLG